MVRRNARRRKKDMPVGSSKFQPRVAVPYVFCSLVAGFKFASFINLASDVARSFDRRSPGADKGVCLREFSPPDSTSIWLLALGRRRDLTPVRYRFNLRPGARRLSDSPADSPWPGESHRVQSSTTSKGIFVIFEWRKATMTSVELEIWTTPKRLPSGGSKRARNF